MELQEQSNHMSVFAPRTSPTVSINQAYRAHKVAECLQNRLDLAVRKPWVPNDSELRFKKEVERERESSIGFAP